MREVSAVVRCGDSMLRNGHARILLAIHPTDTSMGHTQVGGREERIPSATDKNHDRHNASPRGWECIHLLDEIYYDSIV